IAQRDDTIFRKQSLIEQLTAEIRRLRRQQFAARSEKMPDAQRSLFDEAIAADLAMLEDALEAAQSDTPPASHPAPALKAKPARRPLPAELPRIETRHEPESCDCAGCGAALVHIGDHVSEKLDCKPL